MGRKRERDDSSSSSSSDSSESDSDERKKKKRSKKRHKEEKKRKKEKRRKKEKKKRDESPPRATKGDEAGDRQPLTAPGYSSTAASRVEAPTPEPVVDSSKKKAMCPQRPEEYQAQQSVVREVYDPETGRMRLVRGTGEIIERIVSRDQQREINRRATQMDGLSFQASLRGVIQPPGR